MTRALLPMLLLACTEPEAQMVRIHTDAGDPTSAASFWIDTYEYPNQRGDFPEVGVDFATAQEKCAAEGKRLCSAAEWRLACGGPDGARRYGYGARFIPRICHSEVDLTGGHTSLEDGGPGSVSVSGAYLECRTPDGVHDMVGNVEEWVTDAAGPGGAGLEGGAGYTHRSWADCSGDYSRQPDYRLDPSQAVGSAGFRCCKDAEDGPTPLADPAADQARRLAAVNSAPLDYAPANEAEVAPGLFMDRYEHPNRPDSAPTIGVDHATATAACAAERKRLCTTVEWERACAGRADDALPYGPDYVRAACNIEGAEPGLSGRHLACASEAGVYDLVGNVWEWTATELPLDALRTRPDERRYEVRGGSWRTDRRKGVCKPDDGYPAADGQRSFTDVGFRCCRGEAQPTPAPPPPPTRCPDDMVSTGGVCVERYESPSLVGTPPEGNLSWAGAQAACATRGKRVCTDAEWTAACAGPAGRRWPYGDTFQQDACFMDHHEQPTASDDGAPAPSLDPEAAGARAGCVTPDGVADLSGNLWEWVATDGGAALRGGGWSLGAGLGQCRARATPPLDAQRAEFGVRCCADPLTGAGR